MREIYKVPVGKQYTFVVWEVAERRYGAVFDEINGTMSQTIEV